ncbi:carboxy terminal-processing peptidase [soil metagenome]
MLNKKVMPFVLPVIAVLVLLVAKSWGNEKSEPATKYEKILTSVGEWLEQGHFSPKKFDDAFSKQVFSKFISDVDPDKTIFLQPDIDKLKALENQVDNELRTGKMEIVPAVEDMYKGRMEESAKIAMSLLEKPFDFATNETVNLDRDKAKWPKNDADLKEVWRKKLKYMVLERYAEAIDLREKNKDSVKIEKKADTTLERESRDRVRKIYERSFNRLRTKFTMDDKFNLYINTIAETMDPHTEFFPPVEKRSFDEMMSGHFFGIGAQLQENEGNIKIVALITGSPAQKSGEVQVNDIIMKVGQGNAEPVDITGMELPDAVKLIKGKKGTEVRITLKKTDGTIKTLSLIRDEIVQEEAFARSAIVNKDNRKIGYIYLPDFYADFENPNGANCARDVANEIIKLKAENVDGIIMDLRYNGGGSLPDVIKMVGLFIEDGPVVQVKDRYGEASVYRDKDKSVLYSGPLAVMINEFSASASEIFAAAIQDYGRGIIIGTQSYGKGTVQRNVSLDAGNGLMPSSGSELGSLKLTIQKFYRINGGSNQLKGITPNVILPDNYEFSDSKEKNDPNALPWDEIATAPFKPWPNADQYAAVEKQFQVKVDLDTAFQTIRKNAEWLSNVSKNEWSLNLTGYQDMQKKIRAAVKQNEKLQTLKDPMNINFMKLDDDRIVKMDKEKGERFRAWLKGLKNDMYLDETSKIMNDLITNDKTAKN